MKSGLECQRAGWNVKELRSALPSNTGCGVRVLKNAQTQVEQNLTWSISPSPCRFCHASGIIIMTVSLSVRSLPWYNKLATASRLPESVYSSEHVGKSCRSSGP